MIKILHIASFTGNIGDEANHKGFISLLEDRFNENILVTELEIRKFYKKWDIMRFDDDFVKLSNDHDLIIFGGGNFFELCWDYSSTGTTIDIELDILEKIKKPIVFNALGVDDNKGTTEENILKFKKFLERVLDSNDILFSVRNDGSMKILKKYYEEKLISKVNVIPDWGFYVGDKKNRNVKLINIEDDGVNIGINLAGDMKNIRYSNNYEYYCAKFSELFNKLLLFDDKINLIFYPHMYMDLEITYDVIKGIDDIFIRNRILVAPLLNGKISDGTSIFDMYNDMDLILSMRFHSNVCSIGQNIPNIGLITYPKHGELFKEIELKDRCIYINDIDFFEKLYKKIIEDLSNLDDIRKEYMKINSKLSITSNKFIDDIYKLIGQK